MTAAERCAAEAVVVEAYPGLLERRPRAVARALSALEAGGARQRELVQALYPRTGRARVVGITGPPGSGKSTLVDRFARVCRAREETVGILAVDPTSPFTGGALLGDRVRMQELYTDPGTFIRSMATRGALGGLARATRDAVDVLDAAGFDWVLVETVGVGQDEVDVMSTVQTVVVVTVPGLGDEIQAIKAGVLEIADVFVVNKGDRDGVESTVRDLESMLQMGATTKGGWRPEIVRTIATRGQGIGELLEQVERHREWLVTSGELERRSLRGLRLRVENLLRDRILELAGEAHRIELELEIARAERADPYTVAGRLFERALRSLAGKEGE
ncbi:MAG TPA: methylmalonyl Co-A mutase-associated GTPase MeaB [Thermoanaerobaculia bacterium]|nr:methylmalonyl Co-A mutase-associated GTPase MeaB [Thermoanaerobaculia bacterium]